jgi:polyhydroxyalkanoate synthesis regulator phasin
MARERKGAAAMGKKSKSFEESEERLTKAVRESAQEIWKAGLGAFTDLQKRARAVEGDRAGHVRETVNSLEKVFEERVTRALDSIGVPMRQDINALIDRVDELSRQVEELKALVKKPVKKATTKKA